MSAWVVSEAHINVLVRALLDRQLIEPDSATSCGRMLLDECIKSVMARYGDESVATLPGTVAELERWARLGTESYRYTDPGFAPTDAEASVAAACYGYQSCEHRGWERSKAYQLTERGLYREGRFEQDKQGLPWGFEQDYIDKRRQSDGAEVDQAR